MSGGVEASGLMSVQVVVELGRPGIGGDVNGGLGDRMGGGGGGDGRYGDRDRRLIRWKYTVKNVILGT